MDNRGQVAWEYILIMAISILIAMSILNYVLDAQELNLAMSAARSGACEGSIMDGLAIYPKQVFNDYESTKPRLINPSSIKIIKIECSNKGFNEDYGKIKIQLRIYASAPTLSSNEERNSMGDRINYNARKNIAKCFKTDNLTNTLFNPVFSPKYMFTTADVKWV